MHLSLTVKISIGIFLMAFCGSQIGHAIDSASSSIHYWLPGFAAGIIVTCSAPISSLKTQLKKLEGEIASMRS